MAKESCFSPTELQKPEPEQLVGWQEVTVENMRDIGCQSSLVCARCLEDLSGQAAIKSMFVIPLARIHGPSMAEQNYRSDSDWLIVCVATRLGQGWHSSECQRRRSSGAMGASCNSTQTD